MFRIPGLKATEPVFTQSEVDSWVGNQKRMFGNKDESVTELIRLYEEKLNNFLNATDSQQSQMSKDIELSNLKAQLSQTENNLRQRDFWMEKLFTFAN